MIETVDPVWVIGGAALVSGALVGWTFGLSRGRKQVRPDLDWNEFVRENAGYDFGVVRNKADAIVALANEISRGAAQGSKMVRTLSIEDDGLRRFNNGRAAGQSE